MTASLPIRQVEKPWGRSELPAPFCAPDGKRIGEIWFEPPQELSGLLVKYIFTGEKLSVQVHPSDAQTVSLGMGRQGKEECWLITGAEPGATLGIGFHSEVSKATIRAAALDGTIESLMTWHEVSAGDFFSIPANTVHAIGAGVSLIEIQQNSDVTYRLYDYGRQRELHLDEGTAVASGEAYALELWHQRVADRGSRMLVNGPQFRLDQVEGPPSANIAARYRDALLIIPRVGGVVVLGEAVAPGACAWARSVTDVRIPDDSVCLLAAAGSAPGRRAAS